MNILILGGAGYIGSHCVAQLQRQGHRPVVLDNLVYGHQEALDPELSFYQGDLGDYELVCSIVERERIEAVMHFAAFAYVGESVENPLKYYQNNVVATVGLLRALQAKGVKKFIFSSTCATYGEPETLPITEETSQVPVNPYGETKLVVEKLLRAMVKSDGFSVVVFRYFNAAGAAPDGQIGEDHDPETHLIPLVIKAAMKQSNSVTVFGNDYPTPDGTCQRDYVHVEDLAEAHILALGRLNQPSAFESYNLGTGRAHSVLEVIEAIESVSGCKVPYTVDSRRAGDPPVLYAESAKAQRVLGWKPKYDTLESIVRTAWSWHRENPEGYESNRK